MEHKPLKVVFISDTHGQHRSIEIPACDVLVFAGDYTDVGDSVSFVDFYDWLMEQDQCEHKIFIEGNHELMADAGENVRKFKQTAPYDGWSTYLRAIAPAFQDHNIHRLHDSSVTIEGVKFWGSPTTLAFYNWAFNKKLDELQEYWEQIPEDVDVLITHGPPLGKRDRCINGHHAGDPHLLMKILQLRPKVHVFGHIHEGAGTKVVCDVEGEDSTLCINASVLDENYNIKNEPFVLHMEASTRVL